ncbi:MAG: DNA primase [Coriobacteriia bacterium]
MSRISDEDIARVRDATDAVALISETVVMNKKGRLFWGCCPFHGEKTPSFKVDPGTGLWHCFGCGAGGDVFGYLMRRENVEFPDAVRQLADRARIELEETGEVGPSRSQKDRLMSAHDAAAEFYHTHLMTSHDEGATKARAYLANRGFGTPVAKTWKLGYSPGRGRLTRHLTSLGFSAEEMVTANLAFKGDDSGVRDRFYERIMFPIHEIGGKTIGFGGRIIGKGEPKYLNTSETPVFHKSQHLYAIDVAKNEIVKAQSAVVVEGYTDVIALHEAGIRNAVATLGTALTRQHIKLLGRFTNRIVYLFDADEAGLRAAERAIEFIDTAIGPAGSQAIDLRVAIIPEGMDPADYVAVKGAPALLEVLESAIPLMQFVLDRRMSRHALETPEGRANALADVAGVLKTVAGSLLAQDYTNKVADRLLTDYATVERAISSARPAFAQTPSAADVAQPSKAPARVDTRVRAERELVGLLVTYPQLRLKAQELLSRGVLTDPRAVALLGMLAEMGSLTGEELDAAIATRDPDAAESLKEWVPEGRSGHEPVEIAEELLSKLKELSLERLIIESKARMKSLDPVKEKAGYDELFREAASLAVRLDKMRRGQPDEQDREVWE